MTISDVHTERYELIDRIAVGGMAEVYRAKVFGAHGFAKTMAIKRILAELAADPEFESRFISEAKLAVELSHANVVQVFDFGRFAGSLFIAMEFVDGLDLAALLKWESQRASLIPLQAAFQIAIDMCRGLDYAHKHGVVHRDVSPSNVLLSQAGEVKIADFGIAEAVSAKRDDGPWRKIMGKWRYMSPEQTRGEHLGVTSDIFSLGSLMFELFTGNKLFPGDDPKTIAANIESMPIPSAAHLRAEIPPRLDEVLQAALHRDPRKRTGDASAIQRQLTEICYESAILATPLDVAELVSDVVADRADDSTEVRRQKQAGVDELIRQQLLDGKDGEHITSLADPGRPLTAEVDRRTEVAEDSAPVYGPAIVSKRKGQDGITVWELDSETVAAAPAAIRGGKRPTGSYSTESTTDSATAGPAGDRKSKRIWYVAVALAAVAGASALWLSVGPREPVPAVASIADAGVAARPSAAVLIVDSVPSGARVVIDGDVLESFTPAKVPVVANRPTLVTLQLPGYRDWTDPEIVVGRGETLRIRPQLSRLLSGLEVVTKPAGATVVIDGEELGITPFARRDLPVGPVRLQLVKDGYRSVAVDVTLSTEEITKVERTLKSTVDLGAIDLQIDGGWADVYLGGRRVGRAPARGLKLPVGRHRLRLYNPKSKAERRIDVEVSRDQVRYYRTSLPTTEGR